MTSGLPSKSTKKNTKILPFLMSNRKKNSFKTGLKITLLVACLYVYRGLSRNVISSIIL